MADDNKQQQSEGQGWHGDSKGHAKAGSQSGGKFKKGSERAKEAGRKGGSQ